MQATQTAAAVLAVKQMESRRAGASATPAHSHIALLQLRLFLEHSNSTAQHGTA